MCPLSPQDQHVCQSYHGIAEAVTCLLGGAQFSSYPLYHPRSSCCRFRPTRKAAIGAGNFPDSHGISDDFKRQNRSHQTEPVPQQEMRAELAALDRSMPTNPDVSILEKAGGWIKLSPLLSQPEPANLVALKEEIARRWPMTSLLDILKETDLRVGFTHLFRSPTAW